MSDARATAAAADAADTTAALAAYADLAAARAAGEAFLALALDYLAEADAGDAGPGAPRAAVAPPGTTIGEAQRFAAPPAEPRPLAAVVEGLRRDVVERGIRLHDPMYAGHQVCPPLPAAAFADLLVATLNQSQAVREMSPATTAVELGLVRWACRLVGWGDDAGGSFVSGGSAANLTALLAARATRFPQAWSRGPAALAGAALVTGAQAHYSVARAAGILGLGADAVVAVATTPGGATDPAALAGTLAELEHAERPVLAVVATAGSTATGAYDDLEAIAALCRPRGIWLHVDGAHGASGLLSRRLRERLRGVEHADSLAWDPHKMMFQPLSTAMVLARRGADLERAFRQDAPYLFHAPDPAADDGALPSDSGAWTLQCSRRADALRLWLALELHGTRAIGALIDHTVELAAALHRILAAAPDFRPLHEPECNILCFRYEPAAAAGGGGEAGAGGEVALDALQDRLRAAYNRSGAGWITVATVNGRRALRVTLINPRTREHHLRELVAGLRRVAGTLPPQP
jgi:L-2,4-diaminobutyrate decarboxylase